MTKLQTFFSILLLAVVGCAHNSESTNVLQEGPLTEKKLRHDAESSRREELKFKRFVAKEKSSRAAVSARQNDPATVLPKAFPLPEIITEETLYSEVLRAYQVRALEKTEFFAQELERRYPRSVFNDNALYLCGQLKLSLGMPSHALKDFEALIKKYPTGNKRAAALLGKGIAYRKLQLFQFSEKVFGDLKDEYPGSPEFYKAEIEEKLLKVEKDAI